MKTNKTVTLIFTVIVTLIFIVFVAIVSYAMIMVAMSPTARASAQVRTPLSNHCRSCIEVLWPAQCIEEHKCTEAETKHYTQYMTFEERQAVAMESIARSLKRMEGHCQ